jgi:hypothetical protein
VLTNFVGGGVGKVLETRVENPSRDPQRLEVTCKGPEGRWGSFVNFFKRYSLCARQEEL